MVKHSATPDALDKLAEIIKAQADASSRVQNQINYATWVIAAATVVNVTIAAMPILCSSN